MNASTANSLSVISSERLQALGFNQQPFQSIENPEDIYKTQAQDMLLTALSNHAEKDDMLSLVIGEQGIGKSHFFKRLLYELPSHLNVIPITPNLTLAQILKSLLPKDKQHINDLKQLTRESASNIFHALGSGIQPVLAIDDAHDLNKKTFFNLLKFRNVIAEQNKGTLKLILLGERSLESDINALDDKLQSKDLIYSALLRPFNYHETLDYLSCSFRSAGNKRFPFDQAQTQQIQKNSGGIPARINEAAIALLNKQPFSLSSLPANRKIAFAVVICLCLGLIGYWQFNFTSTPKTDNTQYETKHLQTDTDNIADKVEISDTTLNIDNTDIPSLPSTDDTIPIKEPIAEPDLIEPASEQLADTQPPQEHLSSSEWLLSQPTSAFMIQLIGTWNYPKLEIFLEDLDLPLKAIYYKTQRNNEEWHVLLYGPFPDYQTAKNAILDLPKHIQDNNPWVRSIASIQKTL